MHVVRIFIGVTLFLLCFQLSGCRRSSDEVWEDSKSAGRHVSRGFRTLGGKHGDSRAVESREDFMPLDDSYLDNGYYSRNGPSVNEFIPLQDQARGHEFPIADFVSPQPKETPGDPDSSIPGIEAFRDPSMHPALAGVFCNIHFEYNSSLVKGQENLEIVRGVADYMRRNSMTYVFIEGHCDERGPEAYNLALGAHRSNAVRNLLIREGVCPDNIFTISYGKERPLILEQNEEAWSQNRRAEFKVYQR
jgi:peptidoglycan-associated lipoprotein